MCIHKKIDLGTVHNAAGGKLKRLGKTARVALAILLPALPALSACQGALTLNDPPSGTTSQTADMSTGTSNPDTVSYADINRDLDQPLLGCTLNTASCHGGSNPAGKMLLKDNALVDMAKLMDNYNQVKSRVDTTMPAMSNFLLKVLETKAGGISHTGPKPFTSVDDPTYQRWLKWIQLGAKFEAVSTKGTQGQAGVQ